MRRIHSRKIVFLLAGALAASGLPASTALAQPYDDRDSRAVDYAPRGRDELRDLAAPVALYPDALLAQVLVACTYPLDVVSASQYLRAGRDPNGIDDQRWDASVKGVARYPRTLDYLAEHVDWMNNIGDAFLHQEADVMDAVQDLRAEANAAGNLVSNDKERVVVDENTIEIIPSDPAIIYVPEYDPQTVYVERRHVGDTWAPLIGFGLGVRVGGWLHHDFDWHDRTVYVGDWGRDRPWWRNDDFRRDDRRGDDRRYDDRRGDNHRYEDVRPGIYNSQNVTNIRNTTIVNNRTDVRNNNTTVVSNRWQRDAQKPAPQPRGESGNRAASPRAGSGYPAARTAADRSSAREPSRDTAVPNGGSGVDTSRSSNRGRQSRDAATPAPARAERPAPEARPTPQPAREPTAQPRQEPQPAREAHPTPQPRQEPQPAREARPTPQPQPAPQPRQEPRPAPQRSEPAPQRAEPAPQRAEPAPQRSEPAPQHHSEPAPRQQSEPNRGAATGGYQRGAEASHSSDRGSASRGSSDQQKH